MKDINEINLPWDFVDQCIQKFPNVKIYLVGGTVRDIFLDRPNNDIDLVLENISFDELVPALESLGHVVEIFGRNFGVIKFRPRAFGQTIDVSLPRQEEYLPGMRKKDAKVAFKNLTIYDDLARRDFTINAMAIDLRKQIEPKAKSLKPKTGDRALSFKLSALNCPLLDPFQGRNDLEAKLLRAVGDPAKRFKEDPTRMLRAIRFACQLDFQIEEKTRQAICNLKEEIFNEFETKYGQKMVRVPAEMIGAELIKALNANPYKAIKTLDETCLLPLILPEVEALKGVAQPEQFHSEGDAFIHTLMALQNLDPKSDIETKLAVLLHDIGKKDTFKSKEETGDRIRFNNHDKVGADKAAMILERLKLPRRLIENVVWLIGNHMKLPYSFPRMRLDKQKRFARDPRFGKLIEVACADAKASICPGGKANECEFIGPVQEILTKIKEEKNAGKPEEILSGNEIISFLKSEKPDFDEIKHGKTIGAIKKEINSMYDREEIKTKTEALAYIKKNFTRLTQ